MEKESLKAGWITLCVIVVVFLGGFWINDVISCRYNGYEKSIKYENGKIHDTFQGLDEDPFPSWNPSKIAFESFRESIKFDNFERYIQCRELLNRADRVVVTRFELSPPHKFTQLTKYTDASEVSPWNQESIESYVSFSVYRIQKRHRNDSWGASWLTVQDNASIRTGRFELIKSFDIEWLKNESLDEAHLIGIWQGGWLFRSNKPDHYVWVN
jgi:hypothetical protein